MPEQVVAFVLAAGIGARVGYDQPKQFLDIAGRPVLAHAVANLAWCSRIVVAHHPAHADRTRTLLHELGGPDLVLVPGGATRRESLAAALGSIADLPDEAAVVVQNGASPNTPRALVESCLQGLAGHDVVQAFVPAVQTVLRRDADELVEVLPRHELGFSVDPTVYRLGTLRRVVAAQRVHHLSGEMTLDTARALGLAVRLVASPESNLKVTTPNDLVLLRALMRG